MPEALKFHLAGTHFIEAASSPDFKETLTRSQIDPNSSADEVSGLRAGKSFVRLVSQYGEISAASEAMAILISGGQQSPDAGKNSGKDGQSDSDAAAGRAVERRDRDLASGESGSAISHGAKGAGEGFSATEGLPGTLPPAVLLANQQLARMPLSMNLQGSQLVLTWIYPPDPNLDHWEIWESDPTGKPLRVLQSYVDPGWTSASLPLNHLNNGELLMMVGRDSTVTILSTVVSYTSAQAVIPSPVNLRLSISNTSTSGYMLNMAWDPVGSPENYLIQVFNGQSLYRSEEVPGSTSTIQLTPPMAGSSFSPLPVQVCVMALNGASISAPLSSCFSSITNSPTGGCSNSCPASGW